MRNLVLAFTLMLFSGCAYTDSVLQYANQGTARVEAGYKAKAQMTQAITAYLLEANRNCGVKVEIIDNKPVTTVKECVRASDLMASVDKVAIVKPQRIKDVMDSAGDFAMKITNLAVPFAGVYYGYKSNKVSQNANVAITQSNNKASEGMWENYTKNFQNTQSTKESIKEPFVPTIETNQTKIGGK